MEQIGKEQGQNSQTANPNFFTYWSIMRTYLRKGQEKHTNKAYSLLKRMEFAVNGSFCSASMTTANDRFHRCFIFTKPASGIEEKNRAELCESAFMVGVKYRNTCRTLPSFFINTSSIVFLKLIPTMS